MDENKAKRALAAVEKKYKKWLEYEDNASYGPKIMKDWALTSNPAPWAIVWEEGSPDDWALKWGSTRREDPSGIYMEPLASFALGVYDGD